MNQELENNLEFESNEERELEETAADVFESADPIPEEEVQLIVPKEKQGKDLWGSIKSVRQKFKKTKLIPEEYRIPDNIIPIERHDPDPATGLTKEQVDQRFSLGLINRSEESASKSNKEIVYSNIFTYFNLIFFVIAILLIVVGSFRDLTFLPIVVANTLIGIIQELRSKKVLDDLRILNAPKNTVVRDGKERIVPAEDLVLDDIVVFSAGNQIPADAIVEEGEVLVNESLITGESDQIQKKVGSELLSGSFIVSGVCRARIDKVGDDSYVAGLTRQAKELNDEEVSEMIRSLDRLVKIIGILIIPISIILFSQQFFINHTSLKESVTATVAAIVGMIPEGLYLLASVALAVSAMRLATQKVLVHNMKCIETLARVDVLCVDKTGTITDNTMTVKKMIPLAKRKKMVSCALAVEETTQIIAAADGETAESGMAAKQEQPNIDEVVMVEEAKSVAAITDITIKDDAAEAADEESEAEMEADVSVDISTTVEENTAETVAAVTEKNENMSENVAAEEIKEIPLSADAVAELELALGDFAAAMATDNITMKAIKDFFRKRSGRRPEKVFSFSSATKYSGAVFEDCNYVLGAPEFILREQYAEYAPQIEKYSKKGFRVLVFCKYLGELDGKALKEEVEPMGMVLLANPIRKNAPETFRYFAEQGVNIKVISGDNPVTVAQIAKEAGIKGAERFVDASTLTEDDEIRAAARRYNVFGRVTPDQKRKLVSALKDAGHTVAMTGDGVNDVLALKDADCSIAMASGSDAAAQVAQLVLLESDFSRMPSVVAEGRRVVNNIERTASLFLVKNIFSLFMSILSILLMVNYPLEPSQVSLISMFTIGIPAFIMSLEPNSDQIKGHFLSNVLFKAFPGGLTDFLVVSAMYLFCLEFGVGEKDVSTASTILLAIVGMMILYQIASPMNKYHWILWLGMGAGLLYCMIFVRNIFAISSISKKCIMLLLIFAVVTEPTFRYLSSGIKRMSNWYLNRKQKAKV